MHALCKVEQVHSGVGSGDCLLAGLAIAYTSKWGTMDAAKFGASCGAANCLREELGLLYRKDVDRLLETCEVQKMEKQFTLA